jgi:transcriptional regulator with XRE-family HTH domain
MQRQSIAYGSLVARNLRAARAAANLSQEDVGERMRDLGFTSWARSTMSLAEQGKRRVTAEELAGLAVVFEVDLTSLAYPPGDGQPVSLPGGQEIVFPAARFGMVGNPARSVWDGNRSLLTKHPSREQQ